MENTIENKVKFFVQYWGQDCLTLFGESGAFGVKNCRVQGNHLSSITPYDFLILKSLADFSDEDAYHMAVFVGDLGDQDNKDTLTRHGKEIVHYDVVLRTIRSIHADFLRSRGYLIPFNNLTPDQILEYGWAKIRTK